MKNYIHQILSIIVLSIVIISACSETDMDPYDYQSNNQIDWTEDIYIIPFSIIDDKIYLDAQINEVKGKLRFEMSYTGLQLNENYFTTKIVKEGALILSTIEDLDLQNSLNVQIGDFNVKYQSAEFLNSNMQWDYEVPAMGVVGRDLFTNADLAIDYSTQVITVHTFSSKTPIISMLLIE